MKIVFIYKGDTINLGIAYLSSYLKEHGHKVDLVIMPSFLDDKIPVTSFVRRLLYKENIIDDALKSKPDLIGFSVVTAHYQWALDAARQIKAKSDVPIIFGAHHPTTMPEETIKQDCVDMICLGEGEEALLELADSIDSDKIDYSIKNIWFKKNGDIIKNEVRALEENLNKYPFPDMQIFLEQFPKIIGQHLPLISSRQCPYSCTYCVNHVIMKLYRGKGKFVRQRCVDSLMNELNFLMEKYKPKTFGFIDDVFTFNKRWLREFSPRYKKEIGKPFNCLSHPKVTDEEVVCLLKEAGCSLLILGVQTGVENIRKNLLNRPETNEDVLKAASVCKKYGLNFTFNHIANLPFEKEEHLKQAVKLYNEARPKAVDVYGLVYFPKTKIVESGIKAGILTKEDVKKIAEGQSVVYQVGFQKADFHNFYRQYSLLLSSIPILPRWMVNKIIEKPSLLSFFKKLPLILVPMVKVICSLKTQTAYLQLSFFNNVFYHFKRQLKLNFLKNAPSPK